MNYIDLVAIVSIGVMAVLFGTSKLYVMVYLAAVTVATWVWQRYTAVIVPLDSLAMVVGLYIAAGFLTTLVWHVSFLYSVRAKYREFLASALFKKCLDKLRESYSQIKEEELHQLKNFLGVYGEVEFGKLFYLNVQHELLRAGSGCQDLFKFGPTMALSDTYIPSTGNWYYFGWVSLKRPEVCEEYLNKLLPPKLSMFGKVLVFVWVFWPVALTWLVCYRLFGLVLAVVKKLAAKLYDGLGGVVFRKV